MKIRLFTSAFPAADPVRALEFNECLSRNLLCTSIDAVHVFMEGTRELPESGKLIAAPTRIRPTYSDFFSWISEIAGPDDISILANADIFFDQTLAVFRSWQLPTSTAFALSRWEIVGSGSVVLNDRNDSQDSWIFRGKVVGVEGNFPVGAVRCDNRIAHELQRAGYTVLNPSFSVRTFHLHSGEPRDYGAENRADFVPPPYSYIWPHNLWPLWKTIVYNRTHPAAALRWRLDRRWSRDALRLGWLRRVARRAFTATQGIERWHR